MQSQEGKKQHGKQQRQFGDTRIDVVQTDFERLDDKGVGGRSNVKKEEDGQLERDGGRQ